MAETEYNVEKLHEINKNKLIDVLSQNNVQPQYHGDISSNKSANTKQHPISNGSLIIFLMGHVCLARSIGMFGNIKQANGSTGALCITLDLHDILME